jgi:hypothetical protein
MKRSLGGVAIATNFSSGWQDRTNRTRAFFRMIPDNWSARQTDTRCCKQKCCFTQHDKIGRELQQFYSEGSHLGHKYNVYAKTRWSVVQSPDTFNYEPLHNPKACQNAYQFPMPHNTHIQRVFNLKTPLMQFNAHSCHTVLLISMQSPYTF